LPQCDSLPDSDPVLTCISPCVQAFSQALSQAAQDPDGCNGTAVALAQAQAVAIAQGNSSAAAGECHYQINDSINDALPCAMAGPPCCQRQLCLAHNTPSKWLAAQWDAMRFCGASQPRHVGDGHVGFFMQVSSGCIQNLKLCCVFCAAAAAEAQAITKQCTPAAPNATPPPSPTPNAAPNSAKYREVSSLLRFPCHGLVPMHLFCIHCIHCQCHWQWMHA
jgi:hypothetical protein